MKKRIKDNLGGLICLLNLSILELVSFIYILVYISTNEIEKTTDFMLAYSMTVATMSTLMLSIVSFICFILIIYDCKKEGEKNGSNND